MYHFDFVLPNSNIIHMVDGVGELYHVQVYQLGNVCLPPYILLVA